MNTLIERQALRAAMRDDFPTFVHRVVQTVAPGAAYQHNWHIDAIAWKLVRCMRGEIKRLIITLPPRSLKSICASVAFPAYLLGHDPTQKIIAASYANELTAKHARDCRAVMESRWYKQLFPQTRLSPKKSAELEFETTRQGGRYGTSLGGALTGRGGNVLIVDDPMKPGDALSDVKRESVKQWFDGTLYSRLDSKKDDVIIVVMQRLHEDDLVGYLLEKEHGWVQLDLPAIADHDQIIEIGPNRIHHRASGSVLHEDREPLNVLEDIKREIGSAVFSAQYLQRPVPVEGNLIKWQWFQFYDSPPAHNSDGRIVQSWDTANKAGELNDWSACSTWLKKRDDYYLLSVNRFKLEYPLLKKKVIELSYRFGAHTVLIEDKGSGTQLIQDLTYERAGVRPIAIEPETDKVTRMSNQSAEIEAGRVHIPREAVWLDDFKSELLAFPNGRHDDQVDSVSQFLFWATRGRHRRIVVGRTIGLF